MCCYHTVRQMSAHIGGYVVVMIFLHRICSFRECGLANIGLRMLGGKMCDCRDEGRAEVER